MGEHVNGMVEGTLFLSAASWLLGANITGKPRIFMPYLAGVHRYREEVEQIVADNFRGFAIVGSDYDSIRIELARGQRSNGNGIEGLEQANALLPTYFLDIGLPDMDNCDGARRLMSQA